MHDAWRIGPASAFFSQLGAQPKSKIPQIRAAVCSVIPVSVNKFESSHFQEKP